MPASSLLATAGPAVPSWLAPTVIASLIATVVNFLFNVVNLARSKAQLVRSEAITDDIERYKLRVNQPISECLRKLGMANVEFGSFVNFKGDDDTTARVQFANEYQLKTLNPVMDEANYVLQQADSYIARYQGGTWVNEIDQLDDTIHIIGDLRQDGPITRERYELFLKTFVQKVSEFCSNIADKLILEEKMLKACHSTKWFGMRYEYSVQSPESYTA